MTVFSALAALGLGGWASVHVFGFPALDNTAPLFAFLFLVALGVDYTIFLVTRAREETPEHGTRDGIVRAVSATGAVITSAGVVLAAVFCVLGVLPLIVLTQVGIIVGLGILLDTFVVRTVIIPALFTLIGPRIWWPALRSGYGANNGGTPGRHRARGGCAIQHSRHRRGDDVLAEPADDGRHVGRAGRPLRHRAPGDPRRPPGFGESQKLTAPFTFDDCARCIVDILDGLGVQRTHFVGNSWGGMIGGTFAAAYPDRIGSAVLMNCTASPAGARQKIEYGLLLRMAGLLGGIRPPLTRSVLKAFLGPTTFTTRPDVVAFVRDTVQRVDVRSGGWAVRSVVPARPDQRALLSRVKTPVLVVAGVEDATFPLPETIAMAEAIPDAAIAVLEGVAHLAALENPPVVNKLIEEFVFRGSPTR